MEHSITTKQRIQWVDWMKTLAMYFIIAGHCNVPGKEYIYAFSVPCFYILSGFLTKCELELRIFWQKLWWNLAVPMFLFAIINLCYCYLLLYVRGELEISLLWKGPILALLGFQGQEWEGVGIGAMWFVYTLIVCKIIFQFLPKKNNLFWTYTLCVLMFLLAYWINHIPFHINNNSYVNVFLAMPFFIIGVMLRPFMKEFSEASPALLFFVIVVGGVGVWYCGTNNNIVYLYRCSYGSDLFLCIVGALFGTASVFAVSRLLEGNLEKFIKVVGGGTIVILGLHGNYFLHNISVVTNRSIVGGWKFLECALILLIMFPIIIIIKRYLPFFYGYKKVK